ncbi:hypothetical protein WJ973_13215 [Achromobacter xylosoxidans]
MACHGADGKGNQVLGAPNLTDEVWLTAVRKRPSSRPSWMGAKIIYGARRHPDAGADQAPDGLGLGPSSNKPDAQAQPAPPAGPAD